MCKVRENDILNEWQGESNVVFFKFKQYNKKIGIDYEKYYTSKNGAYRHYLKVWQRLTKQDRSSYYREDNKKDPNALFAVVMQTFNWNGSKYIPEGKETVVYEHTRRTTMPVRLCGECDRFKCDYSEKYYIHNGICEIDKKACTNVDLCRHDFILCLPMAKKIQDKKDEKIRQEMEAENEHKLSTYLCDYCGNLFDAYEYRCFCSDECERKYKELQRRRNMKRRCPICKKLLNPRQDHFCSVKCREKALVKN